MTERLLSVVIPSRNDRYEGNSGWRLTVTLETLARSLARTGLAGRFEAVIVDWGSERPLHLDLPLSPAARELTRFVLVPPGTAARAGGESSFPAALALNVGFRRGRGEFLCQNGNDVLWTEELVSGLAEALEGRRPLPHPAGRSLMILPRRHVPWEVAEKEPSAEELAEFIAGHGPSLPADRVRPWYLTPAGSIVIPREICFQCGGLDESLVHWGLSDADLTCRVRLHYPAMDLGREAGLWVYHLQHRLAAPGRGMARPERENEMRFGPFAPNGGDWGLGRERFAEVPPAATADVSLLGPARRAPELARPGARHLRRILEAFAVSPADALDALALFARSRTPGGAKRIFNLLRRPAFLRRAPAWARRIKGDWGTGRPGDESREGKK